MAARLGLDPRIWQLCTGVNKKGKKTVYSPQLYFQHIIFYTLPPDEYNKTYSDEELKCSLPKVNANGLNIYVPKVIEKTRLEVDVVHEEELDVTTTPTNHSDTEEEQ